MGFLGLSLTKNYKQVQRQLDLLTKSQCERERLFKIAHENVEAFKIENNELQKKLDYFQQAGLDVIVANQGEELAELNEKVKQLESEKKDLLQYIGKKEKDQQSMSEAIKKLTIELAAERASNKIMADNIKSDGKKDSECCKGNYDRQCCKKKKKDKKGSEGPVSSQG